MTRGSPRFEVFSDASLQSALAAWNHDRLAPRTPSEAFRAELEHESTMRLVEDDFVARARRSVAEWTAEVPTDEAAFLDWFVSLEAAAPGQHDPLFAWLRDQASLGEVLWFLRQEVAGEAGFDDLVAMAQVKMPTRAKLECARNYWDEMGRGKEAGMHGPMLADLARDLPLPDVPVVPEALAVGNLLVALAANRRFAFHALGALGAIELTAPGRAACVNEGLRRLGVEARTRRYYALHATLDVQHARGWNAEVIAPLVASNPALAIPLAEGALLRLAAGAASFARYRVELGLSRELVVHVPDRLATNAITAIRSTAA